MENKNKKKSKVNTTEQTRRTREGVRALVAPRPHTSKMAFPDVPTCCQAPPWISSPGDRQRRPFGRETPPSPTQLTVAPPPTSACKFLTPTTTTTKHNVTKNSFIVKRANVQRVSNVTGPGGVSPLQGAALVPNRNRRRRMWTPPG